MKNLALYAVLFLVLILGIGFYNASQAAKPATTTSAKAAGNTTQVTPAGSSQQQQLQVAQQLERVNQLDPQQYSSTQEYNTWAYSACSAAAMTEVINAFQAANGLSKRYRITEILAQEVATHSITPELGLLEPAGIDRTVAQFGFRTTWLSTNSAAYVVSVANKGLPVIVGFPPQTIEGGHLLVVKGGDAQQIYLADSSRRNWHALSYAAFASYWRGFAVVLSPAAKGGQQ